MSITIDAITNPDFADMVDGGRRLFACNVTTDMDPDVIQIRILEYTTERGLIEYVVDTWTRGGRHFTRAVNIDEAYGEYRRQINALGTQQHQEAV